MGWSTGRGTVGQEIKDQIETYEGGRGTVVTLRHCLRGNILWTVRETTVRADQSVDRWIGCTIIKRCADGEVAVKEMSESAGPCYYSCPLEYLDMVPEPNNEFAGPWRLAVRQYHARRKELKCAVGDIIHLKPGCSPAELEVTSVRPFKAKANGLYYKISKRYIESVKKAV